jgi:hypothetical protein
MPLFKRRLDFVTYSPAELAKFHELGAKPVWDAWVAEMSAKGVPARELLDLIFASAKARK